MLIEHWVRPLIAVLGLAAVVPLSACNADFNSTIFSSASIKQSSHKNINSNENGYSYYNHSVGFPNAGKYLTHRENQMLIRADSREHFGSDCCPSVLEMIEPMGGSNQMGNFVHLYRSDTHRQRFYELSCHRDVVDKPCRYLDRKLHEQSKCVQKYSYTYALVRDAGGASPGGRRPDNVIPIPHGGAGDTYTLDYIKVRSGCACVLIPKNNKKKKRGKHRRTDD